MGSDKYPDDKVERAFVVNSYLDYSGEETTKKDLSIKEEKFVNNFEESIEVEDTVQETTSVNIIKNKSKAKAEHSIRKEEKP